MPRCSRCHEDKDISEFYRNSAMPSGYCHYCKACKLAYDRACWGYKAPQPIPIGYRRCPGCQVTKPIEEFGRDRSQSSGLSCWCKECHRTYQQETWYSSQKGQEVHRKAHRARRARKQEAPGAFTSAEFETLCSAVGHKCLCCGKKLPLVPDHVVPLSQGGTNDIGNIQPLCAKHNAWKGSKLGWDFRVGFEAT